MEELSDAASLENYPNPRLSMEMEGPMGHASLRKSSDDANSNDNFKLFVGENESPNHLQFDDRGGTKGEGIGLTSHENGFSSNSP